VVKVLVTGATGFVGRSTCLALARAGAEVIAAARRHVTVPGAAATRIVADVSRRPDWDAVLQDTDAIVHLAAHVHVTGRAADSDQFRRINVDGTAALVEAALAADVRRFVYVSSIKVLGERSGPKPLDATSRPSPEDAYAVSKLEAEAVVRDRLGTAREPVILRPPLVYGPGVGANFLSLLRLCDTPWPLPLGLADNFRSLIFVENLADAIGRAATTAHSECGPWIVTDGEDIEMVDLVRRLRRLLGHPQRLLNISPAALTALAKLVGRSIAVGKLLQPLQADSRAFCDRFQWTPPFTVDDGLAATVRWYVRNKVR
jgi:nucleoside-diphosphate-sugar epimerase